MQYDHLTDTQDPSTCWAYTGTLINREPGTKTAKGTTRLANGCPRFGRKVYANTNSIQTVRYRGRQRSLIIALFDLYCPDRWHKDPMTLEDLNLNVSVRPAYTCNNAPLSPTTGKHHKCLNPFHAHPVDRTEALANRRVVAAARPYVAPERDNSEAEREAAFHEHLQRVAGLPPMTSLRIQNRFVTGPTLTAWRAVPFMREALIPLQFGDQWFVGIFGDDENVIREKSYPGPYPSREIALLAVEEIKEAIRV